MKKNREDYEKNVSTFLNFCQQNNVEILGAQGDTPFADLHNEFMADYETVQESKADDEACDEARPWWKFW